MLSRPRARARRRARSTSDIIANAPCLQRSYLLRYFRASLVLLVRVQLPSYRIIRLQRYRAVGVFRCGRRIPYYIPLLSIVTHLLQSPRSLVRKHLRSGPPHFVRFAISNYHSCHEHSARRSTKSANTAVGVVVVAHGVPRDSPQAWASSAVRYVYAIRYQPPAGVIEAAVIPAAAAAAAARRGRGACAPTRTV